MNYVRFGDSAPKSSGWTSEEDSMLFEKFIQFGAKWVQIGREMVGRYFKSSNLDLRTV